jgi:hypothetical protein
MIDSYHTNYYSISDYPGDELAMHMTIDVSTKVIDVTKRVHFH